VIGLGPAAEILAELIELPPHERPAALSERCGEDAHLLAEVRSLLLHHDDSGRFLNPEELLPLTAPTQLSLSPGQRIGEYTILSLLGSGGMGSVYIARQDRPSRTVALKVIHRALASPAMIRRFEREAELLGRLHHPGIAQVFQAGAAGLEGDAALPFIAMELIAGSNLLQHAQEYQLDTPARIHLLVKICDAVQHAHQRGIIHRDLKPGNIVVDPHGQPKVLDFGVARVTDADLHMTQHTGFGQLIGTLPYMSPEQVVGDPSDIDTRCDVYALGVMLFELLAGRLPHDLRSASIIESARILREEPAPRLASIDRAFKGDLDIIAATALEKDKTRRYQSAAALADDLRRFLAGQPIAARDASALAQLSRRVRRYRGAVAAGTLVLAMTAALAAYAWNQASQNRRLAHGEAAAKHQALAALDTASIARSRLSEQVIAGNIERGRLLGRAGSLDLAETLLWQEHLRNPANTTTRWALWELYARHPQRASFQAHDSGIRMVRWNPGSRLFATGSANGELAVWDAHAVPVPRRLLAIDAHAGGVWQMDFSPDESMLATAGHDGAALWSASDGALIGRFLEGTPQRSVAFHPRRPWLLIGGVDGALRILDLESRTPRSEHPAHQAAVVSIRFNPDGLRMVTASDDHIALVWPEDVSTSGIPINPSSSPRSRALPISAVSFSPDGSRLAGTGVDHRIHIYDLASGERTQLDSPNGVVRFVDFLPDGTLLTSGYWSTDRWNVHTGERQVFALQTAVSALEPSGDGSILAVGQHSGVVRLVDLQSDAIRLYADHSGRCVAALSPDAAMLASADEEGTVRLRSRHSGEITRELVSHRARVRSVRFSPDGALLAAASDDGMLRITDLASDATRETPGRTVVGATSIAFAPRDAGRIWGEAAPIATITRQSTVEIIDALTGAHLQTLASPSDLQLIGMAWAGSDGHALAATSRDRSIHIWYTRTGELRSIGDPPSSPWVPAFSPDGSQLAVGYWGRHIRLHESASGMPTATLQEHNALVSDLAYRPGYPSMAASCSRDGLVMLWDLDRGQHLATIDVLRGCEAFSVSFSQDGRYLAVGSTVGQIAVIDLLAFETHIEGNLEFQRARLDENPPSLAPER
jgi:eukaryotic-like serine/threonine-protein kinase